MESIIHKHYKNNLICNGMQLLSCGDLLTIVEFETEVDLKRKFNMNWDKTIIVDILAKTNKGYVVIEIYDTNPKLWAKLSKYYSDLSKQIINFFEVKVSKVANQMPMWKDKALLLKEENNIDLFINNVSVGDFYFGLNSKPYKVNNNLYQVKCVHRYTAYSKYSNIVTMQFDLSNKYITEKRLHECFGNNNDLLKSQFNYVKISESLYQCISFYNPKKTGYSKYDQQMINKIKKQLDNMKVQNKIVYAKE